MMHAGKKKNSSYLLITSDKVPKLLCKLNHIYQQYHIHVDFIQIYTETIIDNMCGCQRRYQIGTGSLWITHNLDKAPSFIVFALPYEPLRKIKLHELKTLCRSMRKKKRICCQVTWHILFMQFDRRCEDRNVELHCNTSEKTQHT